MSRPKIAGSMISSVAEIYRIHPQTLRLYERLGLIKPSRSHGNTRLYANSDLNRLELILNLTRELGVNLAGVEVILNMREKLEQMQNELQQLVCYVNEHLSRREDARSGQKHGLVPVPASKIIRAGIGKK